MSEQEKKEGQENKESVETQQQNNQEQEKKLTRSQRYYQRHREQVLQKAHERYQKKKAQKLEIDVKDNVNAKAEVKKETAEKTNNKNVSLKEKVKTSRTWVYLLMVVGGIALFFLFKRFFFNKRPNQEQNENTEGGEGGEITPSIIKV
jgi:exonuclease VII large subunit